MATDKSKVKVGDPDLGSPLDELREVTDVRTLRALAHPVRIALLEALALYGPLTATEVGERIGESPTTCSFHLRQLAKYGFVEEAGGGKGRARPWRVVSIGMQLTSEGDDPDSNVAATAVAQILIERHLSRYQAWRQSRSNYPKEWRRAAAESQFLLFVTAAELDEFNEELATLVLSRFGERLTDHSTRPAGSVPVEMLTFSYPLDLPSAGSKVGGVS
jgi:DNA-binding transcriptional ArsR family regulator